MMVLVGYYIADDRKRKKVADLLLAHGFERIQLSLFIGPRHPARMKALWLRLQLVLDTNGGRSDRLLALSITTGQLERLATIGRMDLDLDLLMGRKSVLFI